MYSSAAISAPKKINVSKKFTAPLIITNQHSVEFNGILMKLYQTLFPTLMQKEKAVGLCKTRVKNHVYEVYKVYTWIYVKINIRAT